MRVSIKERLRPFSHRAGAACLLPGTELVVRAYPTQIEVGGQVFALPHSGPVKGFTLLQDLEKGVVKVFGHAPEGYFCYLVVAGEGEVRVGPWTMVAAVVPFVPAKERLFLGCTKKLDWEMAQRRGDAAEVLPVWYALAQVTPKRGESALEAEALMDIFAAGFEGIFVPQGEDRRHLGVAVPEGALERGGVAIRSLFVEGNRLLPRLPRPFRCGRMTGVKMGDVTVDFAWTKGFLREVVVRGQGAFSFGAQRELKEFRVRTSGRDRGYRARVGEALTSQGLLLLDNFTK